MVNMDILGIWLLVIMTLSILSYLYGDNPFYKAAEHIFVGVSAGYIFAITWWDQIWPNLFGRLFPKYVDKGFEFEPIYIIPLILGIFMLLRLIPSLAWLARISIAYIVGMAAGLKFIVYLNSNVLLQIKNSSINFNGTASGSISWSNWRPTNKLTNYTIICELTPQTSITSIETRVIY